MRRVGAVRISRGKTVEADALRAEPVKYMAAMQAEGGDQIRLPDRDGPGYASRTAWPWTGHRHNRPGMGRKCAILSVERRGNHRSPQRQNYLNGVSSDTLWRLSS